MMESAKITKINNTNLFNKEFLKELENNFNFIIKMDDCRKAFELCKLIESTLLKHKDEIAGRKEFLDFYNKIVIQAKFVALPLLDDKEVLELLKNYFTLTFNIEFYDIFKKINSKLISINVYEERDQFKAEARRAILENKEVITKNAIFKLISEWLNNYNIKLGMGLVDNLKKTQYFVDLDKMKELNSNDKNKLKTLFNLYEELKKSTFSPNGMEEETPIIIDNIFYIFKKGNLEEINEKVIKEMNFFIDSSDKVEKLKKLYSQYPTGSLERKAIEEEMRKISKL